MRNASFVAVFALASSAEADTPCLPKTLKAESPDVALDLGLVASAPVLCTVSTGDKPGVVACWDLDAASGKLTARAVAPLPGHGVRAVLDAKGCVDGYCAKPDDGDAMVARSVDGSRVVLRAGMTARVFDAASKKLIKQFSFTPDKAGDDQFVTNAIIDVLYVGNTVYAVGSDAGPYIAVWAFKDDGSPLGSIKNGTNTFSVYGGAASVLDDSRIVLTDVGMQHVAIITAKAPTRTNLTRDVKLAPCKAEDVEMLGETTTPSGACKKHLAKNFLPYSDTKIVALPSGDLLVLMSGKERAGQLAILDGKKLTEKKRLSVKICAK